LFPKDTGELIFATSVCINRGLRYRIIGNASNILFDDKGFDGVIIFTHHLCQTEYIHKNDYCLVKVGCGKSLTELSAEVGRKHSLSGLEFAYGIPGTVGGSVFMNAGAYGGQMSDVVTETEYLDTSSGEIHLLCGEENKFSYRYSIFAEHPEYVVLSVTLKLAEGNAEQIFEKMSHNMTSRKEKQPLEYPNAGSTFKRPAENIFVGKLIEEAGLKGHTVGGAQISEKHAGFTVNIGGASSRDVLSLIEYVKSVILEKYGVVLESEIIHVPFN
jgi:UDP-N-acetylmuramate dehydrogenase